MNNDELIAQYSSTSRRGLYGSLLLFVVVTCSLVWNAQRLINIESAVTEKQIQYNNLRSEITQLNDTLRALKDAPGGGVRATALALPNVRPPIYDFFIWIDLSRLSQKKVLEVHYDFAEDSYPDISSRIKETGFGAYFRGPLLPGGNTCPGKTQDLINFDDAEPKLIDFDLCTAVGLANN